MEIAANNIANARSTRAGGKGPYRRQQVVFETQMAEHLGGSAGLRGPTGPTTALKGVQVTGIIADESPLPRVYNPGHPDADENGMVTMPNVTMPFEMVDLMTASRAYEARWVSRERTYSSWPLMSSPS